MKLYFLAVILFIVGISSGFAQHDSIIFNNGNYIVGEIKSMERNVLKVETDYSDTDFAVEWNRIKEIYTETYFLITLTNGARYNGTIKTVSAEKVAILTGEGENVEVAILDIVILNDLDQGFWSQLYASIDLGYDLTKANNFHQFSMRSNVGYMAKRWQLDGNYSSLTSKQDDVDDIIRNDGGLTFKYFLPRDWYPTISLNFLSNTEQQLDLRTSAKLGMGKYVVHTNKSYWGFSLGANYNNENYTPVDIPDRKSWEGFVGTELNFFNVGDLSLLTNLIVYPSFTESGRWRYDFNFDAKYDLPLDFYIKLGYTLNFDNQPVAGSPKTDYVIHSGFGWEW
jgi:preprotein translocase subunit YajC